MQRFKGVTSGKQSFREHCATNWLLEVNPRNISASKISHYTVLQYVQKHTISTNIFGIIVTMPVSKSHNSMVYRLACILNNTWGNEWQH